MVCIQTVFRVFLVVDYSSSLQSRTAFSDFLKKKVFEKFFLILARMWCDFCQ